MDLGATWRWFARRLIELEFSAAYPLCGHGGEVAGGDVNHASSLPIPIAVALYDGVR